MSRAPDVLPAAWRARVAARPDGCAVRYFDAARTSVQRGFLIAVGTALGLVTMAAILMWQVRSEGGR